MSAFVCAPETISSVVDVIENHEEVHDRDLLAKRLFLLNVESVNQRYQLKNSENEGDRDEYQRYLSRAEEIKYIPQPERHAAQHVTAANCWIYQSCEGDCDKDPLFLAVRKIVKAEGIIVASAIAGRAVTEKDVYDVIHAFIRDNKLENTWN